MLFSGQLGAQHSKMLVKDASDEFPNGVLTGYAAVFNNVDLGGDIMIPGSFQKTIAENLPKRAIKLFDSHRVYSGTDAILGVVTEAKEDAYGLHVTAPFSSVQSAQDVRAKIKEGIINAMSFGFDILKDSIETMTDGDVITRVRKILEVRLYEVSVVAWGMNPKAYVIGAKSRVPLSDFPFAPVDHVWDPKAAAERFKTWVSRNDAENWGETQWGVYSKGFLFQEGMGSEDVFKLPVVDIVNDQPVYVLGAIAEARDTLRSQVLFGADNGALVDSCKRLLKRAGVAEDYVQAPASATQDVIDGLIAEMKLAALVGSMRKAAEAFQTPVTNS